jgi:hypothetical protein
VQIKHATYGVTTLNRGKQQEKNKEKMVMIFPVRDLLAAILLMYKLGLPPSSVIISVFLVIAPEKRVAKLE